MALLRILSPAVSRWKASLPFASLAFPFTSQIISRVAAAADSFADIGTSIPGFQCVPSMSLAPD